MCVCVGARSDHLIVVVIGGEKRVDESSANEIQFKVYYKVAFSFV